MKIRQKMVAVLLVIAMVGSMAAVPAVATSVYADVNEDNWFYDSVIRWTNADVVNGKGVSADGDSYFDPDGNIKRGEFAKIMSEILGLKEASEKIFTDVDGHWAEDYILRCAKEGIVNGYTVDGETKFYPEHNITREEIFAMICRALKIDAGDKSVLEKFPDGNSTSAWAVNENVVATMITFGAVVGDDAGRLNPNKYITRAEILKVLDRLIGVYVSKDGDVSTTNEETADTVAKGANQCGIVVVHANCQKNATITTQANTQNKMEIVVTVEGQTPVIMAPTNDYQEDARQAIVLVTAKEENIPVDSKIQISPAKSDTDYIKIVIEDVTNYNIIFALATVPPVLAALDSISSGYDTYAIIERGKTYSGIESIENFYNAGFDVSSNLSTGFTENEFDDMVAKVSELNEADGNAFFNFYVQDGTALTGAAIAANAGLSTDQFHVYMCEDGTGAYAALIDDYITGKTVNETVDECYDTLVSQINAVQSEFEAIMSKTDNKINDNPLQYNIGKAYALAALDNFTYYLQDEAIVIDALQGASGETKLMSCFGVEGDSQDVAYTLNLKYQKISQGVALLSEEQRADYLTLMYGQYYEDTEAALTRTERADEVAPEKKLVFIGTRHSGYPAFASDADYGIGGLAMTDEIPESYEELDEKYKNELLFATEEDYETFLKVLNDESNLTDETPDDVRKQAKINTFNYYLDYMFTLKLTYALYGEEYDLIMKGHPREVIGSFEEWGNKYVVSGYCYDKLMDNVLLNFHANDTTGKYIGMVPYGTAAENLAYLGAELSICGLPSSTYSGYDTAVDVTFILAATDENIEGSTSQVSDRYKAGNLLFTDENGDAQKTVFLNTGNVYKAIVQVTEDTQMEQRYNDLFTEWLASTYPDAKDIDAQAFPLYQ